MKEEIKTMFEHIIDESNNNYYVLIKKNLGIVLDFVERYNKFDKEKEVAEAAQFLEMFLIKGKE